MALDATIGPRIIDVNFGDAGEAFRQAQRAIAAADQAVAALAPLTTPGWPHYLQFVTHGQSLGEGSESLTSDNNVVTTADQGFGSRRFTRGERTWSGTDWPTKPEERAGMTSLTALFGQAGGGLGETPGNGFCDAFKARIVGRYGLTDTDILTPNIVSTFAGRGSTRLTAISSEDTGNTTYSTSSSNVTIDTGPATFTVGAGLTLPIDTFIRMANAADGTTYDFSPYMSGTVTSYNSGTGELVINVTETSSGGGLVTYDDWRLIRDGLAAPGNYWNTMLADVQALADLASDAEKTHAVGAFLHMQGERNADLKIYEYDAAASSMSDAIASYKSKFIAYAGEVQTEIIAITGQRSVPFLTYQTLSNPAAQAQLDASIENPALITMVGPHYACPRAWNGSRGTGGSQKWGDPIHMSADGSRMFGELAAKVAWQVHNGERFEPVRPLAAVKVDATHFDVTFHVPRPPLVLDTDFLAKADGFGFVVYPGDVNSLGAACLVVDAEVIGDNVVRFTTGTNIPANGKIWSGMSTYCDLGVYPAITAVGDAGNTPDGFDTNTISIAGDQRPLLAPLTNEGAFGVHKVGATSTRATIRKVEFTGGNTVLTYEDRESAGTFAISDQIVFARGQTYTNLRDSDPAAALYNFADEGYPARLGQPYPLWNWCALFAAFPIEGA